GRPSSDLLPELPLHDLAQHGPRAVDAALHRAGGEPRDRFDLLVAHLLDVAQHEAFSEAGLDLLDGALDDRLDLFAAEGLVGPLDLPDVGPARLAEGDALGDGLELLLIAGVADAEVFGAVFTEVDGDAVNPRRELGVAAE